MGKTYVINEEALARYGPRSSTSTFPTVSAEHGSAVQFSSIYSFPKDSSLNTPARDNRKTSSVMIHRVVLGSIEDSSALSQSISQVRSRFGSLPYRLRFFPYRTRSTITAQRLQKEARQTGIRYISTTKTRKIGYKIREARLQKTPYMLVVGEERKERQPGFPFVQERANKGAVKVEEFLAQALEGNQNKGKITRQINRTDTTEMLRVSPFLFI